MTQTEGQVLAAIVLTAMAVYFFRGFWLAAQEKTVLWAANLSLADARGYGTRAILAAIAATYIWTLVL
jgi:hypothetical protein